MFTGDVVEAVTHLNRVLVAEERLSLCTICAVVLPDDPDQAPARVLCAGHPRPILVRNGATSEVGSTGPLVGAFEDSVFDAEEVHLSHGDLLALFTDGLTDTRGVDGRLGAERVHQILASVASPRQAIEALEGEITRFEHGPQADDTAIVAIQRT